MSWCELPTVEVRYENVCVDAKCKVVHGKPLPTLWNSLKSNFSFLSGFKSEEGKISILKDVSGIIKPSRVLETEQLSSVSSTLDLSPHPSIVVLPRDMMKEVTKKEKHAGIVPESDVDTYMKAIAIEGLKRSLQTDYILKILGLDICADTVVGNAMRRGISGGEMITGPTKVLLMDEISTGLDSTTIFQIVSCLQQLVHITECTMLVSLLQPAPETIDLFDDIILMAEGKIIYHGPCSDVLELFEGCGFKCPERKGIADFLQEVISRKDQAQHWYHTDRPYNYVSTDHFIKKFQASSIGQKVDEELLNKSNRCELQKNGISFGMYSLRK
ncbi:hypothetical protein IFM89_002124 [Coptis chinensis]|uniref:ABC transporter family G domain-containing protein n=1 Tax=Coptis chinensis TaxID=261450 RepID=A0A835H2Q6_9MAGN|nr:hypothetical protein IFM89_002124 [Coptis chinensis]